MSNEKVNLDTQQKEEILGAIDITDTALASVSGGCVPNCGGFLTTVDTSCNGGAPCP